MIEKKNLGLNKKQKPSDKLEQEVKKREEELNFVRALLNNKEVLNQEVKKLLVKKPANPNKLLNPIVKDDTHQSKPAKQRQSSMKPTGAKNKLDKMSVKPVKKKDSLLETTKEETPKINSSNSKYNNNKPSTADQEIKKQNEASTKNNWLNDYKDLDNYVFRKSLTKKVEKVEIDAMKKKENSRDPVKTLEEVNKLLDDFEDIIPSKNTDGQNKHESIDMKKINIENPLNEDGKEKIKEFKNESVDKKKNESTLNEDKQETITEFPYLKEMLKDLKLSACYEPLMRLGIDNFEKLISLQETDLANTFPIGHKIKIIKRVKELRELYQLYLEQENQKYEDDGNEQDNSDLELETKANIIRKQIKQPKHRGRSPKEKHYQESAIETYNDSFPITNSHKISCWNCFSLIPFSEDLTCLPDGKLLCSMKCKDEFISIHYSTCSHEGCEVLVEKEKGLYLQGSIVCNSHYDIEEENPLEIDEKNVEEDVIEGQNESDTESEKDQDISYDPMNDF